MMCHENMHGGVVMVLCPYIADIWVVMIYSVHYQKWKDFAVPYCQVMTTACTLSAMVCVCVCVAVD